MNLEKCRLYHFRRVEEIAAESGADAQWSFLCVFKFHDFRVLEYRCYLVCFHFSDGNLPCLGDVLRTLVKNYCDGQKILICVIEKSPRVVLEREPVELMQHTDAPETEAYRLKVGEGLSQYALILFSYVIFLCHNYWNKFG